MKCQKHPRYQGKSKPKGDCEACLAIWQSGRLAEPEELIKKMSKGQFTLAELGLEMKDIRHLKDRGYRVCQQSRDGEDVFYVATEADNNSLLLSGETDVPTEYKWLEASDVHVGSKQFDEVGFREILARAVGEGYNEVHMSGDLTDGFKIYPGHLNNLRYWKAEDQASYLGEILLNYPLRYIATKGNHDFSYEKMGSINPLALISMAVPNFTYLDSFAGDLIIGGVLKRLIHGDGGRCYAKSYPAQTYLRNLFDSQGEHAWVMGNKYRLRFIQFGHWHTDIAFEAAGIYITHPGNFQFPNDYTIRRGLVGSQGARFTRVIIEKGRVIEYTSTFVKPRRKSGLV